MGKALVLQLFGKTQKNPHFDLMMARMKSQGIAKVSRIHPLRPRMSVHKIMAIHRLDILVWIKKVNLQAELES